MKFYADKENALVYGVENGELKEVHTFINGIWEKSTSFSATKELLFKNAEKLGKLSKFNILANPTPRNNSCDKKNNKLAYPLCPIFSFISIFLLLLNCLFHLF